MKLSKDIYIYILASPSDSSDKFSVNRVRNCPTRSFLDFLPVRKTKNVYFLRVVTISLTKTLQNIYQTLNMHVLKVYYGKNNDSSRWQ